MMIGMTKVKIAVSLPEELVAAARRAVARGEVASVSGYVAEALELRVRKDDLRAYLAESLERSGGPPTPEELAWAADIVGA